MTGGGYGDAVAMSSLNIIGALTSAASEQAEAGYKASALDANAASAIRAGQEVERVGAFQTAKLSQDAAGLIGTQRVGYAAQGVDVGKGSAAIAQGQAKDQSYRDVITLQNNIWAQQLGFRAQAVELRRQGALERLAGRSRASRALALGGLRAAEAWMKYAPDKQKDYMTELLGPNATREEGQ